MLEKGGPLIQQEWCCYQKGKSGQTCTQEEYHVKTMEAEIGVMLPQAKAHQTFEVLTPWKDLGKNHPAVT